MHSVGIDVGRYNRGSKRKAVSFLTSPGCRFMVLYRLCNRYGIANPLGILFRMWYKRMQVRFGFQIPHTCTIGPGLFIGHYGNIVINQGSTVGSNCNIAQGVTIGNVSRGPKSGCPRIGDRVWIGANAVVVGKVSIGNDVLIAPLTFVNFDVPDFSVVLGNPGRIVSTKGSSGYIKDLVDNT